MVLPVSLIAQKHISNESEYPENNNNRNYDEENDSNKIIMLNGGKQDPIKMFQR